MIGSMTARKTLSKTRSARKSEQPPVSYLRRTITIPPDLDAAIDEVIGAQNFSAFAQSALAHEVQRVSLRAWLSEREAAHGGKPPGKAVTAYVERAWRNRK